MPSLLARLRESDDVLIHYAPLHSMLSEDWGKPMEVHLSQWILEHPDRFQDALARSYAAGCDFGSTSTQSSSAWRANLFGLKDQVRRLNYESARLAREVTPPDKYLVGFCSTTLPEFLQPAGTLTPDQVRDGYREQMEALLEGGIDVFMIVGNQPDINLLAIEVARDLAPDIPIISHCVYYHGPRGFFTMMGQTPREGARMLWDAGADVVGASCGLMRKTDDYPPPGETHYYEGATELLGLLRQAGDGPLSIQPNASLSRLAEGKTVYAATPDEMLREVPNWIDRGARIVGGCCGTNLDHIRAIAPLIRRHNARTPSPRP